MFKALLSFEIQNITYNSTFNLKMILQAIIPGCSLGIPCIGSYLLVLKRIPLLGIFPHFFSTILSDSENVLSFVTVFESPEVSATLFALANTHSIANSLTIVGRSPRYRAVLLTPIAKYLGKTARRDRATTVRVGAFTPPWINYMIWIKMIFQQSTNQGQIFIRFSNPSFSNPSLFFS